MWLKVMLVLVLGIAIGVISTRIPGWWFCIPLIAASLVGIWMDQRYDVTLKKENKDEQIK